MEFATYLYRSGRITLEECKNLLKISARIKPDSDQRKLTELPVGPVTAIPESWRPIPVGDVLASAKDFQSILDRPPQRTGLKQLLDEWYAWHASAIEPISDYSLYECRFGKQLYQNQIEKKLIAKYLVSARAWMSETLIRDQDVVVVTEGTTPLYAGLAIASHKAKVKIATSNGGLVREYCENPAFRANLLEFELMGGLVSAEHRGAGGLVAKRDYKAFFSDGDPRATVVVMGVTGLLADEGPYAPDAKSASIRYDLLDAALAKGVRHIIFLSDFSKMLPSKRRDYGVAVLPRDRWHELLAANDGRMFIVTSPPPHLRKHLSRAEHDRHIATRDMKFHKDPEISKGELSEYLRSIDSLIQQSNPGLDYSHIHEACEHSFQSGVNIGTPR